MLKSDIKRAEALLEREGVALDAERLILAVKASAKAAKLYKPELKEAMRREGDEGYIERLKAGGDMVVGFLIRSSSITNDYYIFEGDLVGLDVDKNGDVAGYYHTGEVVTIRPEDMTLRGAACIDDNSEAHQDIMACARAVVYGSGRGRGEPWFAERNTRRRNPSSRRR